MSVKIVFRGRNATNEAHFLSPNRERIKQRLGLATASDGNVDQHTFKLQTYCIRYIDRPNPKAGLRCAAEQQQTRVGHAHSGRGGRERMRERARALASAGMGLGLGQL